MTQAANLAALGSNTNTTGILPAAGGGTAGTAGVTGFKNRIINGGAVIDQRNAGAAVTVNGSYPVDRFIISVSNDGAFSSQQDSSAPTGFTNSIKFTTTTADSSLAAGQYTQIRTTIEGYNVSDLALGSASAKTFTLSFWVKSSLTGTFAGSFRNADGSRSYVFTYTISSANTWEQKTVTITGDTSGTWNTTNGVGMYVTFDMGSGSSWQTTAGSWTSGNYWSASGTVPVISTLNATWFVTGVQLEVGSAATNFDFRSYGQELILCQRYFEKSYDIATVPGTSTSVSMYIERATAQAGGYSGSNIKFMVEKRSAPTVTFYSYTGTAGSWNYNRSGVSATTSVVSDDVGTHQGRINILTGSSWASTEIFGHYTLSAEL